MTSPAPVSPSPAARPTRRSSDEQVARASGNTVVIFGGLGILAALVMSTIAFVNSTGGNSLALAEALPRAPDAVALLLRPYCS